VVVKVCGLKGRVKAEFGDCYGWVGVVAWLRYADWSLDHVFAFQAAAVDAAGECAGAVPR